MKDPSYDRFMAIILERCHEASYIDSRTGIQTRRLKGAVKSFLKKKLPDLKRYAKACEDGLIDEENYRFLLKATANSLYLEIQKKKGIKRANFTYAVNQIPTLIFAGIRTYAGI